MMPMHQFEQSGEICCNCQLSVRRQDLLYFLREDLAEAPASTLKMALRHQVMNHLNAEDPGQFGKMMDVLRWLSPQIVPHLAPRLK
eukprot:g9682.t1